MIESPCLVAQSIRLPFSFRPNQAARHSNAEKQLSWADRRGADYLVPTSIVASAQDSFCPTTIRARKVSYMDSSSISKKKSVKLKVGDIVEIDIKPSDLAALRRFTKRFTIRTESGKKSEVAAIRVLFLAGMFFQEKFHDSYGAWISYCKSEGLPPSCVTIRKMTEDRFWRCK